MMAQLTSPVRSWLGKAAALRPVERLAVLPGALHWFIALLLLCALPHHAAAQVSNQYTNAASAPINDLTCNTGSVLTRTFSVGNNVQITDVNIGVALLHTYRLDLRISLTSPAGTSVTLMDALGGQGDNLSDLFDDSASLSISSHSTLSTDSTASVPPYAHSFRPASPLSAFNNQTSAGTWVLTICDALGGDIGTFTRSDLYITGTTLADLSLSLTASSSNPVYGTTLSYTLTAANAATSYATATGVTATALLPAGLTFVSASGTGTFDSGTGVWNIGSLAPGASASLIIIAQVQASVGTTITTTAQITASSKPDPDSSVNNGVTSEDDYAAHTALIAANVIACPAGHTATGSGFAASGTSTKLGQIFWLDWSCGATTFFNAGAIVNKTWSAGDGVSVTAQITNITQDIQPYTVGSWSGDTLQTLHAGLNPIGLTNRVPTADPQFRLALSATLGGNTTPMRWVLGDAEDSGGAAANESIAATTNGTAWQAVETFGSITVNSTGSAITIYDPADGGGGTAVFETTAANLSLDLSFQSAGGTAAAFGFYAPYDFSDAPLTGTNYGAASHRTLPGLRLGAATTSEANPFDSSDASGDADDAVALPLLFTNQAAAIDVAVAGPGRLSAWIDWNGDGDFLDSGEQIAENLQDGTSGDSDGAVNGSLRLAVTPPPTAVTTPTIARFRWASLSGIPSAGLFAYGEVEDYALTVIYPSLTITKTSLVLSNPVEGEIGAKAVPGARVRYCILLTNTGSASASAIAVSDPLPASTSYAPSTIKSGSSCSGTMSAEDDDATGADELDDLGASFDGTTIAALIANLAVGAQIALTYEVLIN